LISPLISPRIVWKGQVHVQSTLKHCIRTPSYAGNIFGFVSGFHGAQWLEQVRLSHSNSSAASMHEPTSACIQWSPLYRQACIILTHTRAINWVWHEGRQQVYTHFGRTSRAVFLSLSVFESVGPSGSLCFRHTTHLILADKWWGGLNAFHLSLAVLEKGKLLSQFLNIFTFDFWMCICTCWAASLMVCSCGLQCWRD